MLIQRKPTVTMHSNVEKKEEAEEEEGGTDGKHNMSSRRPCAVINVVLKPLSIPIKSNHLFTQVERVVGGNRRRHQREHAQKTPGWELNLRTPRWQLTTS